MGIKDLWEVIEPAEKQFTLEELAGDRAQRDGGLRIAVDVAIWTFQARSSKGGRQVIKKREKRDLQHMLNT